MSSRLIILITLALLLALASGRRETASAGGAASGGASAAVSAKSETSVAENGDTSTAAQANSVGELGAAVLFLCLCTACTAARWLRWPSPRTDSPMLDCHLCSHGRRFQGVNCNPRRNQRRHLCRRLCRWEPGPGHYWSGSECRWPGVHQPSGGGLRCQLSGPSPRRRRKQIREQRRCRPSRHQPLPAAPCLTDEQGLGIRIRCFSHLDRCLCPQHH